jgi:hypothetical protein
MSIKKVINYYKLDMTPGSRKIRVNVSQNDTGMRRLIFGLHVSDRPWMIPSECTVTISGRKPDGNVFAYEMDAEGCNVSIALQEQMTAVAGSTECAVSVADSSGIVYSCAFDLVVSRSVLSGGRTSQSDIPIMEQAIAAAGEALASAQLAEQHAENAETAAEEAAGSATAAQAAAEAAQEAAAENFDLVFTAPITDPPVIQTAIPATANHTEAEVTAAYAAGKKVNAKIHFTNENPISFDLEPVYTVTMQTDDTERHMYSGLLVTGVDQLDAYVVMAAWDDGNNGEPVIMIAGKVADYAEAIADLKTDVSDLDGRIDALEDKSIVTVPVRIPFYVITNAITQSQASGETKRVDPSKVTTTEDPETLYNAVNLARQTGKPVRFDLAILGNSGRSAVLNASVMRVSILDASQTGTRIGAYFTHADLNFSNNFNGLARLEISVVEERTDNGTVYSVAAYATAEV